MRITISWLQIEKKFAYLITDHSVCIGWYSVQQWTNNFLWKLCAAQNIEQKIWFLYYVSIMWACRSVNQLKWKKWLWNEIELKSSWILDRYTWMHWNWWCWSLLLITPHQFRLISIAVQAHLGSISPNSLFMLSIGERHWIRKVRHFFRRCYNLCQHNTYTPICVLPAQPHWVGHWCST